MTRKQDPAAPVYDMPRYATATQRFAALVIDCVITLPVIWFFNKVIGSGRGYPLLLGQFLSMVYFAGFESSQLRATPGKMLLGLYLLDRYGNRLSPLRALARYAVFSLPVLPFLLCVASPDFAAMVGKLAQLHKVHDWDGLNAFDAGDLARGELLKLVVSFVAGVGMMGGLIWLPIVASQQRTGMHDWATKVRVFHRREEQK